MIKADTKVTYEKGKPEKFTNFELLQTEVEVLRNAVDKIVSILNYNNITKKKEIEAEPFDFDKVFRELEQRQLQSS